MKRIIGISAGGIGQFLIDTAAWVILTRFVSEFGSTAVAGFTIAFRIMMFTLMPAWGMSGAASTLVGQNLGARKPQRAALATLLTARYNFIFLAVVTVLYLIFGHTISSLFSDDDGVVMVATQSLRIIVLGYIFFGLGMTMIQAFNGAGDTFTPMMINIALLWCLEIPMAWFLAFPMGLGATGVFITIAVCHSLHALVSLYFFRKGKWKKTPA